MRRKPLLLEKVITVSLPQPYEQLIDPPIELPTKRPSTPQFSKFLTEDDLAKANVSYSALPRIFRYLIAVYNPNPSGTYVYFYMYLNGDLLKAGYIYINPNYYTTFSLNFFGVKPGDKIDVFFYAFASGVKWVWQGWCSTASHLNVFTNKVLERIELYSVWYPNFSLGNPYNEDWGLYFFHIDVPRTGTSSTYKLIRGWRANPSWGIYNIYTGDLADKNSITTKYSTSNYPYYTRDLVPVKIILRAYRE